MKILVFIFSVFLFTSLSRASNMCDLESTYTYKKIECCLTEKLSKSLCESKIDALKPNFLKLIGHAKDQIRKGAFKTGAAPNCFWTALSFVGNQKVQQNPRTWYEGEFLNELLKTHSQIDSELFQYADVLVYNGTHLMYSDVLGGAEAYEISIPFHVSLYLGDQIVLQKENSTNSVFSITELASSYFGYKTAFEAQANTKTLEVQTYRK